MGLWSWLFGQFIDVIDWTDDSQDTMVWRFPRQNNEIKYAAKLIVRESQIAVFVNEGEIADILSPGTYELETKNLPILTNLQHWDHGFQSPFKAEVYFVNTKRFTDLKWGTKSPIMIRDPEFSMVRLRAFGVYEIQISDPEVFLKEIVGTDGHFTIDEVDQQLSNIIVSKLATVLGQDNTPILDLAANYELFGEHITTGITPYFSKYGLKLNKIWVENISLPEDVQEAMDKRTSREITGDLDAHLKYQTGEAMGNANGSMGDMVGMGAGLAMGQQMAQSINADSRTKTPPPPPSKDNFYISFDGKAKGPFDHAGLIEMIADGKLTKETFVWKQDFDGWKKADTVLSELFDQFPPPINN
ncbi:MAG: SPFH domain-containing protein [Sulfurovum sp.]|nr:SPFH domain-containing protein [Sulfurovum sp.]